ncbi:hypothetical protein [Cellulomonas sp.]|uniref:hypothetical protein n=1 Tax=Cellulomonas sp. TaxID=40001 RepID=UPI003BADAAFB
MPDDPQRTRPMLPASAARRWLGWWGVTIVVAGLCGLIAAAHLARDGLTVAVLTPLGWALAYVLLKAQSLFEYRRGWRHGHELGRRAALQRSYETADHERLPAGGDGDQTPEPWDHPTATADLGQG